MPMLANTNDRASFQNQERSAMWKLSWSYLINVEFVDPHSKLNAINHTALTNNQINHDLKARQCS